MSILFTVPGAARLVVRLLVIAMVLGVVLGYQLAGAGHAPAPVSTVSQQVRTAE
jgi:hypothetical protein